VEQVTRPHRLDEPRRRLRLQEVGVPRADPDDVVAARGERRRDLAADEAGRAGDEDALQRRKSG
jgi:hypothetical protein